MTTFAKLEVTPHFITFGKAGNLYATTYDGGKVFYGDDIYKISSTGTASLFVNGDYKLHTVYGIATDANDNLLIADTGEASQ